MTHDIHLEGYNLLPIDLKLPLDGGTISVKQCIQSEDPIVYYYLPVKIDSQVHLLLLICML